MILEGLQWMYNQTIREHLPRRLGMYNGVAVRERRALDLFTDAIDLEAEKPAVDFLTRVSSPGDHVVVVGGGLGITAVRAARLGASVTVFEAGRRTAEQLHETAEINRVADRIEIHHAVVGEPGKLYSPLHGAEQVDPAELPECDVLEIDVEGAEIPILEGLEIRPPWIIAEFHPNWGSPRGELMDALRDIGYEPMNEALENRELDIGNILARRTWSLGRPRRHGGNVLARPSD